MSASATTTTLFIYGTLKRGGTNHLLLADQRFIATACTPPGYRLFVVADYPGLVRDSTAQRGVQGELWDVDSSKLAELDSFEGVPEKLYRREPVPLTSPHHNLAVETYLYLRTIRGRRPIIDGKWPT